MKRLFAAVFLFSFSLHSAYGWNALGHRLIAQIAYNHLDKSAIDRFNQYNRALFSAYRPQSLVNSAAWMDSLAFRQKSILLMHYIDLPFSTDGNKLKLPNKINVVTAIHKAKAALLEPNKSDFYKGFYLRILLHTVGDVHQPMHAVDRFSKKHPRGDLGGNLLLLGKNPVALNLHGYWDKGGGLLSKHRVNNRKLYFLAKQIEEKWPCEPQTASFDPWAWARESFAMAKNKAYLIQENQIPSTNYQSMVQNISEQQIAIAGCRLANLLNQINSAS